MEKLQKYSSEKELYIGEFAQGRIKATGYYDEATTSYHNYRVRCKNVLAFPRGCKRTIRIRINGEYLISFRTGAAGNNLNHSTSWFSDGDTFTIPDGDNYYWITLANKKGSESHVSKQIHPGEDFGLHLYYEDESPAITDCNPIAESYISNLRTKYLPSGRNRFNQRAVLLHTSDCHGDYMRVQRFLGFADQINADAACITGDVVPYYTWNGLQWFSHFVNSSKSLVAVCVGNHDVYDNNAVHTDSEIYDYMLADIATAIRNATGKTYYYTDISSKSLRVISVNLYQDGATGSARWHTHMEDDQTTWLISTLASTPSGYGVVILSHSPQVNLTNAKHTDYPVFFTDPIKYGDNIMNDIEGGIPLYDIVDAFIGRTTLSKTYTQGGDPASLTVSADFSSVPSDVEFIAHLTGHYHEDAVCYLPGTQEKQLMLNVTCTNAIYGGETYQYLADVGDIGRFDGDATQDAFNAYIIDRDAGTVQIVRVGQNRTYDLTERFYMEIPYK